MKLVESLGVDMSFAIVVMVVVLLPRAFAALQPRAQARPNLMYANHMTSSSQVTPTRFPK